MNICFLFLSMGYGGAERRLLRVAEKFLRDESGSIYFNAEQQSFTAKRPEVAKALRQLHDRRQVRTSKQLWRPLSSIRGFSQLFGLLQACLYLLKARPKAVHLALGGILLAFICKIIGAKVTIEITSPDNINFVMRFRRIILPFTDQIVFVSEALRERFYAFPVSNLARSKSYTLPIPFYEARHQQEVEKEPLVTFCARLIPRKNGYLFAQAVRILIDEHDTGCRFSVIGDGPDRELITSLLAPEIRSGQVTVGPLEDPMDVLAKSLIFVSLINPENYPSQAVLEAMNCSNYLILSKTPMSPVFISGNGSLVEANARSIADAILLALEDKLATECKGQKSYEHLVKNFESEKYIGYLREIHQL